MKWQVLPLSTWLTLEPKSQTPAPFIKHEHQTSSRRFAHQARLKLCDLETLLPLRHMAHPQFLLLNKRVMVSLFKAQPEEDLGIPEFG